MAPRTATRVDLRATRAPAETSRARIHRRAAGWIARLAGRGDGGARLITALCRDLSSVLASLSVAEFERDNARRAARFADGRAAFTDRALVEQRQTIDALRAQLATANAKILELQAERFDEPTRNGPSENSIAAEIAEFCERPTRVR